MITFNSLTLTWTEKERERERKFTSLSPFHADKVVRIKSAWKTFFTTKVTSINFREIGEAKGAVVYIAVQDTQDIRTLL